MSPFSDISDAICMDLALCVSWLVTVQHQVMKWREQRFYNQWVADQDRKSIIFRWKMGMPT